MDSTVSFKRYEYKVFIELLVYLAGRESTSWVPIFKTMIYNRIRIFYPETMSMDGKEFLKREGFQ